MILMPGPRLRRMPRRKSSASRVTAVLTNRPRMPCPGLPLRGYRRRSGYGYRLYGRSSLASAPGASQPYRPQGSQITISYRWTRISSITKVPISSWTKSTPVPPVKAVTAQPPKISRYARAVLRLPQRTGYAQGRAGPGMRKLSHPDDWNTPTGFDHGKTDFPLEGKHEKLLCSGCHAGRSTVLKQPIASVATNCATYTWAGTAGSWCHSQEEWKQPVLITPPGQIFPLTGSHRDTACKSCHFGDLEARKPATDCSLSATPAAMSMPGRHGTCRKCHNTSDWKKAPFDHGKKPTGALTGKHQALSCLQCHRGSLDDALSSDCGSCHRTDDVQVEEHGRLQHMSPGLG